MKRAFFLVFILGLAVINIYGVGTQEQTIDTYEIEKAEMSDKIAELEKEQKSLKEEIAKNKKDMEGFARKLASVLPDAGLENIFSGDGFEIAEEAPSVEAAEIVETVETEEAAEIVEIAEVSEDENLSPEPEEVFAEEAEEIAAAEVPEEEVPEEVIIEEVVVEEINDGILPEIPQNILLAAGQRSYLTQEAVADFMTKYSRPPSWFGKKDIETLVAAYFQEAKKEGINPDIALAQLWYATQSLTHYALLSNCNYANLEPVKGMEGVRDWDGRFLSSETGVRAHIQHLKGYASSERPADIVDPRYEILVRNNFLGTGDTISKLCAMWTKDTSGKYENTLNEILRSLYQYQFDFIN